MARKYSSTAVETTLSSGIASSSSNTTGFAVSVGSVTNWPTSYPYTIIIDPDTALEEVCTVTAATGTNLTVTRGVDGTSAPAHNAGAVVKHGVSARDFSEPQVHMDATSGVHGTSGSVVGTSDSQTLTNKTIAAGSNTISGLTDSNIAAGAAIDKTKISGTAVTLADSQTLTNKTLTSPVISSISNSGTVTVPSGPETLVGRATTDTLTNKTIAASSNTITGLANSNLSGSAGITNANLANSAVTIGSTSVSLGGTAATVAGLTLTSPTVNGATLNAASTIGGVSGTTLSNDQSAWSAWTPTFSGTGWTFTNLVATSYCRYRQVGKRVDFYLKLKATGSVTVGAGALIISLPVAMRKGGGTGADAEIASFSCTLFDPTAGPNAGGAYTPPTTSQNVYPMVGGTWNGYVNSTNWTGGATMQSGSWIAISGSYEAA